VFSAGGGFDGEEAALEIVVSGGGYDGVVGGDEVDAGVVEGEGEVGVVGDDDADRQEAVAAVVEAGVGRGFFGVAGLGGDGDVLAGVGFMQRVLLRGERRFGLARLIGVSGRGEHQCRDKREHTPAAKADFSPRDETRG